jgi:hypothetical protein
MNDDDVQLPRLDDTHWNEMLGKLTTSCMICVFT